MKELRLEDLFALFPGPDDHPVVEYLPGDDVPEPYKGLLVHEYHMTVTVESYHGGPVDVKVLQSRQENDTYARKILLVHQETGRIVQFGIVQIDLSLTSPDVRAAILAGQTPLGRILIEHDVLRRIELITPLRIHAEPQHMAWFGLTGSGTLYGRLAIIHCDGKPAVELLEVVAPEIK